MNLNDSKRGHSTQNSTAEIPSSDFTDTLECLLWHAVVVVVAVTDCALLTRPFWEAVEDEMVLLLEDEDEEDGGAKAADCCGGPGAEVEAVVVFKAARCDALPRCVLSCFPVDPPPFCVGLCLTTFSSSIWVSAVPCARPKSTRAYLDRRERKKGFGVLLFFFKSKPNK